MANAPTLAELKKRLHISEYTVSLAEGAWIDRRKALADGLGTRTTNGNVTPAEYVNHQDQYLSVARYCDEAREILSRYKAGGASEDDGHPGSSANANFGRKVIAVDPHVIRAYCEFWRAAAHRGFVFLKGEFSSEREERDYQLFVYASLIKGSKLVLLDAARSEISKIITFYSEELVERKDGASPSHAEMLRQLEGAAFASDYSSTPNGRLEFIHQKAIELISLRAGAAERQKFALARLNEVLRNGRFYQPEALVRDAFGDDLQLEDQVKLDKFDALVRKARRSSAFTGESFSELVGAYERFKQSSEYSSNATPPHSVRLIRGGELDDLNAIHELHILNNCLRLCDVDAEIVYSTLSTRMYSFLSGFGKNDVLAPIIHPRTALIYQENKLAREQSSALETALASPIAFGRGIAKDDRIRPEEIERFQSTMQEALVATREAFSYSAVAEEDGIEHYLVAFRDIFHKSADPRVASTYQATLVKLRKKIGDAINHIGDVYADAVFKDISETTFEAYHKYTSDYLRGQLVAIRRYQDDEGVFRYTVIPLTRNYRYMFYLHNSFLDDLFSAEITDKIVLVDMPTLLERVAEAADRELAKANVETIAYAKAFSARAFVRACYAACSGEWNLVQSMANAGLSKLRPFLPINPAEVIEANIARGHLLAQELHFLRHLAERALAESSANAGAHGSRLARAAYALNQCSQVTNSLPKSLAPFRTPYSATSMRDTLASIGLLVEWCMKGTWRQITSHDRKLGPILAKTDNPQVAWFGLDILCSELDRNDEGILPRLLVVTETVLERALQCLNQVKSGNAQGHSEEMWRYICLRAYGMLISVNQAHGVLGKAIYGGLSTEIVDATRSLRDQHNEFIYGLKIIPNYSTFESLSISENLDIENGINPFLDGLLAVEDLVVAAPGLDGTRQVVDLPRALRAFADLDENCNRLYRFGFPRLFLRKIKRELVAPILENLQKTYQIKDRE